MASDFLALNRAFTTAHVTVTESSGILITLAGPFKEAVQTSLRRPIEDKQGLYAATNREGTLLLCTSTNRARIKLPTDFIWNPKPANFVSRRKQDSTENLGLGFEDPWRLDFADFFVHHNKKLPSRAIWHRRSLCVITDSQYSADYDGALVNHKLPLCKISPPIEAVPYNTVRGRKGLIRKRLKVRELGNLRAIWELQNSLGLEHISQDEEQVYSAEIDGERVILTGAELVSFILSLKEA